MHKNVSDDTDVWNVTTTTIIVTLTYSTGTTGNHNHLQFTCVIPTVSLRRDKMGFKNRRHVMSKRR